MAARYVITFTVPFETPTEKTNEIIQALYSEGCSEHPNAPYDVSPLHLHDGQQYRTFFVLYESDLDVPTIKSRMSRSIYGVVDGCTLNVMPAGLRPQ